MINEEQIALASELEMKSSTGPTIAADMTDESLVPRIPEELSILPVRGFVVFPGTIVPLNVRRPASIQLLDETLPRTKVIGLLTQRDEAVEDPGPQDLYNVGTAALVLKLIRQHDDHVVIIARGLDRLSLRRSTRNCRTTWRSNYRTPNGPHIWVNSYKRSSTSTVKQKTAAKSKGSKCAVA